MGKIVVIGGGEIAAGETLPFDRQIVELTGKKRPKALFIPTASSDNQEYWKTFKRVYGEKLGCRTEVLFLLDRKPPYRELRETILSADLIYVGGGNTLKMMRRWRKLGVDRLLKQAHKRGIVLAGISAGGICWFEHGHSDSISFYKPKGWEYIRVKGLGLLKGVHCPHFDGKTRRKPRRKAFIEFIKKRGGTGIAIDSHCAVEFVDGNHRVIAAKKGRNAYRVSKKEGRVQVTPLHTHSTREKLR